ncbi:hypothetical protein, partial [Lacticaseibacillus hulanensis]|uniref:hypothetical protein n=1 Tax=Lacticaseibacillus hulanensis TaxID=2493111 RepID=UPI0019D46F3D
GIQKSLHNCQMNYDISSDNHKGIIAPSSALACCGMGRFLMYCLFSARLNVTCNQFRHVQEI